MADEATQTEVKTEVETPAPKDEALLDSADVKPAVDDQQGQAGADGADAADKGSQAGDEANAQAKPSEIGYKLRQEIKQKDEYIAKLEAERDGYVGQGENETDKRLRNIEVQQYLDKVETARRTIVNDNERVVKEIDVFNPQSPDYNDALYKRALTRYARDSAVADENGEIVGYKTPLYDYMKEEADLYLEGANTGAKKGKTASAKMDAASETAGSASGRSKSTGEEDDPFLKGFNSI